MSKNISNWRKVFDEHAIYTSSLITASVPELLPEASFLTERLLQNPKDIANLIRPLKGNQVANQVENLFTEHLKLAAAALEPARLNNKAALENAANAFIMQGDKIANLLSKLNPNVLSLNSSKNLMKQHNNFVVRLLDLRSRGLHQQYIQAFDQYLNHISMMANTIYNASI